MQIMWQVWAQTSSSPYNIPINKAAMDFWEVGDLERSPLSLVDTIEKLLETKSSGFGLESREYGRRDPSRLLVAPSIRKRWH
jgi:hypothetical protein